MRKLYMSELRLAGVSVLWFGVGGVFAALGFAAGLPPVAGYAGALLFLLIGMFIVGKEGDRERNERWAQLAGSNGSDIPYAVYDLTCPNCGAAIRFNELDEVDYQSERSGKTPSTPYVPGEYWDEGTIGCPSCGHRIEWNSV